MDCIHFPPDFVNGDSTLNKTGFPLVFMGTLLILCQSWHPFLLKTPLLCLCSLLKPMILNHGCTLKSPGEPWQNNDVDAWIHLRSITLQFLELASGFFEIKKLLGNVFSLLPRSNYHYFASSPPCTLGCYHRPLTGFLSMYHFTSESVIVLK